MRSIGRIEGAARAGTFSDALFGRGIANSLREDDQGLSVWVHDDARIVEARDALAAFERDPAAFADDAARGKARQREDQRKDRAYRARAAQARRSVHGADGRGTLTLALLGGALVVAAITQLGDDPAAVSWLWLTEQPAGAGLPEVRAGQVWRLVTPILLHFGIVHLGFNLLMWMRFAALVEVRKGPAFFALLVVGSAMASNAAQHAWTALTAPYSLSIVGGLSGVLYALFGYVLAKGRYDPLDRMAVDDQTTWLLLGWLGLCMTGVFGSVANAAHLGGLVWGVAWAFLDIAWFRLGKRWP